MRTLVFIFFVLIISPYYCLAQNMTVYDLYTATASTDVKVIGNFLINSKGFQYVDNYTDKSEPGWTSEVYIFSYNSNVLRINITSGYYKGEFMTFTSLVYKIYTEAEYYYFVKSLITYSFSIYRENTLTDGRKQTIWTAPKPDIKMVDVVNEGNYYKIQIL